MPNRRKTDTIQKVVESLRNLYRNDSFLFERNFGQGICERGIAFRYAHYLQNNIRDYYVDCDFNSSSDSLGNEYQGKEIPDENGLSKRRFIDIIVHKREFEHDNNYFCMEIKKWNNCTKIGVKKDNNNLKKLTSTYGYEFGFHLILGPTFDEIKLYLYERLEPNKEEINLNDY